MIKINLLGSQVEQNPNVLYLMTLWTSSLVIFFISCLFYKYILSTSIQELEDTSAKLKTEIALLEEKTKEVKDIDEIKQDLNNKLSIIAVLKRNKLGPVKVLDNLNLSLSNKMWLESIEEAQGILTIKGKSLDDQSLSLFMRSLESSEYFNSVDLTYSRQFIEEGIKIKDFEIKSKIHYAPTKNDEMHIQKLDGVK